MKKRIKNALCIGLLVSILCVNLNAFADESVLDKKSVSSLAENAEKFSDTYMSGPYYRTLKRINLTGDYRKDIIEVAFSQVGYSEGNREGQWDGTVNGDNNYTEYGRFLGSDGSAWCSEFASWCARMADVPLYILNNSGGANAKRFGAPYYSWEESIFGGGDYTPQPGDLVLWAEQGTIDPEISLAHTSIFYEAYQKGETVTLHTIDGSVGDAVRECEVDVSIFDGMCCFGTREVAFFIAPNYESSGTELKLNKTFYEMKVGENDYLNVSNGFTTNCGAVWNSSDPDVVLCKEGCIVALKEGQAVVTAETNGIVLSCVVNVSKRENNKTIHLIIPYLDIDIII